MTKADLVEKVAREADMTKKDAEQLVEIIFDSIIATLNSGEKIELRGFGSFRVRERNSRKGRNPKTGAAVDIPAKRVAYFKPGKTASPRRSTTTESESTVVSGEGAARCPAAWSGASNATAKIRFRNGWAMV